MKRMVSAPRDAAEIPASKGGIAPLRPSEVFRQRMRTVRKLRQWRQEDLAKRAGVSKDTVRDIESGKRGVTLDDAFLYAATLGVHPSSLFAPLDSSPVAVAPTESVDGHTFRAWIRGQAWVRPDDVGYFPSEVDIDRWVERWETQVRLVVNSTEQILERMAFLVELVDRFEDGDDADRLVSRLRAAADAITPRLRTGSRELSQLYLVMAERRRQRANVTRVRGKAVGHESGHNGAATSGLQRSRAA